MHEERTQEMEAAAPTPRIAKVRLRGGTGRHPLSETQGAVEVAVRAGGAALCAVRETLDLGAAGIALRTQRRALVRWRARGEPMRALTRLLDEAAPVYRWGGEADLDRLARAVMARSDESAPAVHACIVYGDPDRTPGIGVSDGLTRWQETVLAALVADIRPVGWRVEVTRGGHAEVAPLRLFLKPDRSLSGHGRMAAAALLRAWMADLRRRDAGLAHTAAACGVDPARLDAAFAELAG